MNTIRSEHAVAPVTHTRRLLAAAAIGALLLLPLPASAATIHFGSAYTYYNDNPPTGRGGTYPPASAPNSAYGPASLGTTITFDNPVTSFSFFFNNGIGPATFNA